MRSDNNSGVSEAILKAIINENEGNVIAYGGDELTHKTEQRFKEVFENDGLKSYNLVSGTAVNSLIVATLSPTFGAIFCHKNSHINTDECGSIEFQTGGAKLIPLAGINGKITPSEVEGAIETFIIGEAHHNQPSMLSIAQTTEVGTVYTPEEINDLSTLLKKYGLKLHMDGARFANALDKIGCSPAEMTWKSGVDALSFGTTKNGTLGAEVAIFFNDTDDGSFIYRRMRSGNLISKMRFISAQIMAYLENDLWLDNAKHSNAMAVKLYDALKDNQNIEFSMPVQSNMMFVVMDEVLKDKLWQAGFRFYSYTAAGKIEHRLVTSFNTQPEKIERFIEIVKNHS
ncbi:MAG: low specificity L-threonine aldolase [Kordiimonadaceae bacterium]|jgi:threonine aldolase|nr:low specificity L-threonine aldolase [Kordiimonadaceae bacterium]MBT6031434.1 low specificity L-threonine aldolase [Kordiimonadaceae bacterium]